MEWFRFFVTPELDGDDVMGYFEYRVEAPSEEEAVNVLHWYFNGGIPTRIKWAERPNKVGDETGTIVPRLRGGKRFYDDEKDGL